MTDSYSAVFAGVCLLSSLCDFSRSFMTVLAVLLKSVQVVLQLSDTSRMFAVEPLEQFCIQLVSCFPARLIYVKRSVSIKSILFPDKVLMNVIFYWYDIPHLCFKIAVRLTSQITELCSGSVVCE